MDTRPYRMGRRGQGSRGTYTGSRTRPRPTDSGAVMLTARQADVMGLVARGVGYRRAGELLGISPYVVREHAKAARCKLGARNNAQAVAVALRERLIEP